VKLLKILLLSLIALSSNLVVIAGHTKKNLKAQKKIAHKTGKKLSSTKPQVEQQPSIPQKPDIEPEVVTHPRIIRVLIDEKQISNPMNFTIKSPNGFVLEGPSGSKVAAAFDNKVVELVVKDSKLYLKCKDQKFRHIKFDDIEIYPAKGNLALNGKSYHGSLNLRINPFTSSLLVINKLDLEDYICSVLRSESVLGWPHEMQKVQAIASRSYALFNVKRIRQKNPYSLYDIKNSNLNQIYEGVHQFKCLRDAVDQTRGLVLTYKGNIAEGMFDVCCGGVIPGNMRSNKKSPPYLKRMQPCTYCSKTAHYKNFIIYKKNDYLNLLKSHPKLKHKFEGFGNKLHDIQVTDKDAAGVVHNVRLAGRKYVTLTGPEMFSSFGNRVKSQAFTIKKDERKDRLTFVCRGWSHFNGLCQWGAKNLVDRGWDYKRVLNFYYPGTTLSRLKA